MHPSGPEATRRRLLTVTPCPRRERGALVFACWAYTSLTFLLQSVYHREHTARPWGGRCTFRSGGSWVSSPGPPFTVSLEPAHSALLSGLGGQAASPPGLTTTVRVPCPSGGGCNLDLIYPPRVTLSGTHDGLVTRSVFVCERTSTALHLSPIKPQRSVLRPTLLQAELRGWLGKSESGQGRATFPGLAQGGLKA